MNTKYTVKRTYQYPEKSYKNVLSAGFFLKMEGHIRLRPEIFKVLFKRETY